ncbi:hypothetical protein KFE26_19755 [Shewanella sp. M16]|nr:hypothetical protein [Shewanella sp. M16]MBS0044517.1 hypothetical protein [Shewanella sp. M16]QYW06268.1 hypothetical protein MuM162_p27 [Shewanella phage vB_SspM_MuM16-2]
MSSTTIATIEYLFHWLIITMPLSAAVLGFMDGVRSAGWPIVIGDEDEH